MKVADLVCARLKNVIVSDRAGMINPKLTSVLQKDLGEVLSNYFSLDDITVDVSYDPEGNPYVQLQAQISAFKPFM